MMRALEDIGKTLDIQQHEPKDQTPKRAEVVGRSVGECKNILPILVEHLRSALELSADSSNRSIANAESLALDPLSRCNSQYESETKLPLSLQTMDLNFFGDLLVSDIKTALVRLQEILCRVNGDALSRYSSTLEPSDRLNLLQLISNLVANLKNANMEDLPQQPPSTINSVPTVVKKKQSLRRRDRHTIGVSSEELARARKWLEERGTGISLISQRLSLAPQTIQLENLNITKEEIKEKAFENSRACDKHMKDAINQQQSLHSKSKDIEVNPIPAKHESKETKVMNGSIAEKLNEAIDVIEPSTFINKCNKFSAKKFKIKRANTIDIPNYLKLQAQKSQSTSPGLKRPIDISDRLSWNASHTSNIIPSFEPKTENDRKFLALINRNNETNGNTIVNQPFKSFNYRQTSSIADKNWKSRFSNIKTTFDKPLLPVSADESSRRSSRDDGIESFTKDREKGKILVASLRSNKLREIPSSLHNFSSGKLPIFNHAATSPFQKIHSLQKNINKDTEKPLSSFYLPACASNGMLRAKMKMFDQESVESSSSSSSLPLVQLSGRPNVNRKPEKILKSEELNDSSIKQHNNIVHHDVYDKNRQYAVFNNNDNIKINITEMQRRQSVAVQTNNDLIQANNIENEQHDSSIIPRQICSHPSQTYQPLVPKIFYPESDYSIYVPSKSAPRELEFFVDSSMNNKNDKKPWNCDSINRDYTTNDDTSDHLFMDQNIENQDISENRIITRYTSAIGTMEDSPSLSPTSSVQHFTPVLSPNCHHETISTPQSVILHNDVQRHNMLQQSLIRHFQHQNDEQNKCNQVLNTSQRNKNTQSNQDNNFLPIVHPIQTFNDRESYEPLIEYHNTQEKINIFESKSHNINRNKPEALMLPTLQYVSTVLPKINVVSPPHIQPLGFTSAQITTPILKKYSTNPVDSSDEYLVSCANKPHRSIVLSKSESWHQLALSKNHLQVPPPNHPPHKPPRISAQTSKHIEPLSDTFKKMEKVQSYFINDQKHRESKNRRSFSPKQTQGVLSRSHTMPHIFDDASEVDKAFDSLFEETIRDNRH
ncbi:uncharacterized protein [Chelonus insularis]|nr:uncharacterized protein LOC118071300 isoform X2 [Chelonus insularis]